MRGISFTLGLSRGGQRKCDGHLIVNTERVCVYKIQIASHVG